MESPCECLGMLIFSAAFRMGSLSLFGAGLSDGRLVPPPPIKACIACTAGFGLVLLPSSASLCSRCSLLLASATAAAPVKDTGDRPGECVRAGFGLIVLGDKVALVVEPVRASLA